MVKSPSATSSPGRWKFTRMLLLFAIALVIADQLLDMGVVATKDAGTVQRKAFLDAGGMGKTVVTTTQGVYAVRGTIELEVGESARVDIQRNGTRLLCRASASSCKRIQD